MPKSHFLILSLAIALVVLLICFLFHRERRAKRLYVEWLDNGIIAEIHLIAASGREFSIETILVDGVFQPTLAPRKPGRHELWSELTYPIRMTPPCSVSALLRVGDWDDEEIQKRSYPKRPTSILISTSRGDYEVSLT